ncbi:helix-turn-helix transcriptional regulator [Anaerolineales bacterium HSG25]|nr:helix-turn-helix transcriptional regulator [Anaerolineales bacterium HSG25]
MSNPPQKQMERFGEKLQTLRKQDGLTLHQLGDVLGVSHAHIWNIEKGRKLPHATMILNIAHIFGVTPNDLMLDEVDVE